MRCFEGSIFRATNILHGALVFGRINNGQILLRHFIFVERNVFRFGDVLCGALVFVRINNGQIFLWHFVFVDHGVFGLPNVLDISLGIFRQILVVGGNNWPASWPNGPDGPCHYL